MPVLDAVFVGKIYLPEIWSGPIIPPGQPPTQPPGQPAYPQFPIWGPPGMTPPAGPGYPPWVGGGPIVPPPGAPPHPAFPIWGPPGIQFPPGAGYPPTVGGGPIIPPTTPPDNGGGDGGTPPFKPVVGWTPQSGWIVVFVPAEGTLVPTPSATKVEVTKATGTPEAKKP